MIKLIYLCSVHSSILLLKGYYETKIHTLLVTEYLPGGELCQKEQLLSSRVLKSELWIRIQFYYRILMIFLLLEAPGFTESDPDLVNVNPRSTTLLTPKEYRLYYNKS